jgi:hypothetical protein
MNLVFMALMMGLAMVFFHGQGHHKPSHGSEHHSAKPDGAKAPAPGSPDSRQSVEPPGPEKDSTPAEIRRADPAPPAPRAD